MTAYEIATLLYKDIDDRKFAEVFALIGRMMHGEEIPNIYDQESMILRMNADSVTSLIKTILEEIQEMVGCCNEKNS